MAIDLTNNISAKGAVDALRTILKSRKQPLIIEPSKMGKGNGPQLQLPQNVKVRPQPQPKQPNEPQINQPNQPKQPGEPTPNQPGQNQPNQPQQPGQNQPGQPQPNQPGQNQPGQNQPGQSQPGQSGQNQPGQQPQNGQNQPGQQGQKQPGQDPQNGQNKQDKGDPGDQKSKQQSQPGEDENKDPWDELVDDETEDEKQARIDRINDPTNNQKDIDQIRQDKELRDGEILRAKQKAKDEIIKATQGASLQDFSSFSADLFKAISTQIKPAKHKEDSYRRPNPSYAGTNYLVPGKDYPDKKEIPVIAVYFDQSASWGPSDVKKGLKAIASIARFEQQKRIKLKVLFFANHLHDKPKGQGWYENGTQGFPEVLAHINNPANKITNVIVLSDDDIEGQTDWQYQPHVRVRGCVWFLWGSGRSLTAPKYLKGDRGNFEYKL